MSCFGRQKYVPQNKEIFFPIEIFQSVVLFLAFFQLCFESNESFRLLSLMLPEAKEFWDNQQRRFYWENNCFYVDPGVDLAPSGTFCGDRVRNELLSKCRAVWGVSSVMRLTQNILTWLVQPKNDLLPPRLQRTSVSIGSEAKSVPGAFSYGFTV